MKKVFVLVISIFFLTSCGGSSVEVKSDSTDVVDSASVDSSLTASDTNTAHIPVK